MLMLAKYSLKRKGDKLITNKFPEKNFIFLAFIEHFQPLQQFFEFEENDSQVQLPRLKSIYTKMRPRRKMPTSMPAR